MKREPSHCLGRGPPDAAGNGSARPTPAAGGGNGSHRRSAEHCAAKIVVEQDPGQAIKVGKRIDMSAHEVAHRGPEVEAHEQMARVGQHHHEGHQRAHRASHRELAEMRPVDLPLLARKRAQAQVCLCCGPRTQPRHQGAEVIGCAGIAALAPSALPGGVRTCPAVAALVAPSSTPQRLAPA